MVFSELIVKIPYKIASFVSNKILHNNNIYFYADSALDYVVFRNIHKYLPGIKIVAKDTKVQALLKAKGIESDLYPVFPKVLLMARHSLHKFPDKNIITIGMRHGAYHFKKFIGADKYNRFDLFLLTSESESDQAKELGIRSAVSGGFPKIDDLFDKESLQKANDFKKSQFSNDKPTLIFTATWEKSGLSAIDKWYNKLHRLTSKYNIMVTLHPWIENEKKDVIKRTKGVYFVEEKDLTKYLLAADVMIADTSSVIAEYNALDKPTVTFKIPKAGRLPQEIIDMLDEMTYRVDDFTELEKMIDYSINNSTELSEARIKYNKIMFHQPFGNHGEYAASRIIEFLKGKGIRL